MKIPAIGARRVGELPWRRPFLFTLLGLASGVLSGVAVSLSVDEFGRVSLPVLSVAPGLIFGVLFSPLLVWCGWLPPVRGAPWILAATPSNAAAVQCGLTVLALFQVLPPWLRFSELAFESIGLFAGRLAAGFSVS